MYLKKFEIEVGGKTLTAEFTDLAHKANGSVIMKYGETVLLVTAIMNADSNLALPYLPLSVEFEERFYASGSILGSRYIRREGRPSEQAILRARIVDRTIRPLFDQLLRNDVQIVITLLAEGDDDPEVPAVIGASLALGCSDIPWNGPVSAVRIAHRTDKDELIINPTRTDRDSELSFEVLTCGQNGKILMIEAAADEMGEEDMLAIFESATTLHTELTDWQTAIIREVGQPKRSVAQPEIPAALETLLATDFLDRLTAALFSGQPGKGHIEQLKDEFIGAADAAAIGGSPHAAAYVFDAALDAMIHAGAVYEKKRADGRDLDTVRPLFAKAGGISPVLHGTGIFYRGDTHVFTALTLGGPEAAQLIENGEGGEQKRFMHHYNFPPFSVGETGRVGGFNRRMIGHGAPAAKALLPVLPKPEAFPYTIRLVSETMASNGSSSMASVCASTLALFDGGVPIKKPVAGIASGIMIEGDSYALLTDIQGPEDEHGDMDFKVAGTKDGITAIQMDVKVSGVTTAMLEGALEKARAARLHIIDTITKELSAPRSTISPRAPEILAMTVLPSQIGTVIGGVGKTITKIKEESGVDEITIEDDGTVYITGKNGSAEAARTMIAELTKIFVVGEVVTATVTRIAPFGAFARLNAHTEGLIHISEIGNRRLENLDGILTEGDVVRAIVSKVEDGKIGLSIKQVDPGFLENRLAKP